VRPISERLSKDPSSRSISEGLLSTFTAWMLETRFSQSLLKRVPLDFFNKIEANCKTCPDLVVLGETQRLTKHLRHAGGS
jgi:hypothetical protein